MDQESGWEELRKEARKIEGDLDVKLNSYAKLGARVTQGSGFFRSYNNHIFSFKTTLELLIHEIISYLYIC